MCTSHRTTTLLDFRLVSKGYDDFEHVQAIFLPQLGPGCGYYLIALDELMHVLVGNAIDVNAIPISRECESDVFSVFICTTSAPFQHGCMQVEGGDSTSPNSSVLLSGTRRA